MKPKQLVPLSGLYWLRKSTALLIIVLLLSACASVDTPDPTGTAIFSPTPLANTLPAATETQAPTETGVPTATPQPSATATQTPSPLPTETASTTPVPTYVKLRGKVIIDQAVCHYGPGKPYLYKYGVYRDSNLEVIGRALQGTYVQVQAIGGNNPCWVNPEYLDINGDINLLEPIHPDDSGVPYTPYYTNVITGVSAQRSGDEVTISWHPFVLRPGDDSEQVPYIIEAWVCRDGQIVFDPVGFWQTSGVIVDEAGCSEPSHARIFAAEKHGYSHWVQIPWPAHE